MTTGQLRGLRHGHHGRWRSPSPRRRRASRTPCTCWPWRLGFRAVAWYVRARLICLLHVLGHHEAWGRPPHCSAPPSSSPVRSRRRSSPSPRPSPRGRGPPAVLGVAVASLGFALVALRWTAAVQRV
ncbi:hypothetical protein QJS66_16220 [Kocuria rhizophila]|nr:hypothetical protein QJS66_16220 [Kocuria rhizophila]